MSKTITNAAPLAEAAKAFNGAETQRQRGTALSVVGLAQAWDVPILVTIDKDTIVGVTLADYRFDKMKEDGTKDGKFRAAFLEAILSILYGLDKNEQTDAVKVGFKRSFDGACALAYIPELQMVSAKGSTLAGIPLALAVELVNAKGEPTETCKRIRKGIEAAANFNGDTVTEKQIDDRLTKTVVTCDGQNHPIFGKLPSASAIAAKLGEVAREQGLLPAKESRNREKADGSKDAEKFSASVDFITQVMKSINQSEESEIAFTDELETKLRGLRDELIGFLGG